MPTNDDIRWFKQQFSVAAAPSLQGTPFDIDMICAIACQETGYLWATLRKAGLPTSRILELCVGDTIDYKGPGAGRQAFPHDRAALVAKPQGAAMFAIAHDGLVEVAKYVSSYAGAAASPDKFCHGYGMFQRDLQFFLTDPDYFLEQKYAVFAETLAQCLGELHHALVVRAYDHRSTLTDEEFATVAIVYNRGRYDPAQGLKQGYFDGHKYYGEYIYDYVTQSRGVVVAPPPTPIPAPAPVVASGLPAGRYQVIARGGLKLHEGPALTSEVTKTIDSGAMLTVVQTPNGDPAWAHVDLEGDGKLDGYVYASYLAPVVVAAAGAGTLAMVA